LLNKQYSKNITEYALQNSYFSEFISQFQQYTAKGIKFDFDANLK